MSFDYEYYKRFYYDPKTAVTNKTEMQSRARLIAGVLAALLVLGAGVAIGYLIPLYTRPGDNSADAGFLRDMQAHHAQAVEMGMAAYRKVSDEELQTVQ